MFKYVYGQPKCLWERINTGDKLMLGSKELMDIAENK